MKNSQKNFRASDLPRVPRFRRVLESRLRRALQLRPTGYYRVGDPIACVGGCDSNRGLAWVERSGERWWCAELQRLRGVFLTAMDADEAQIEASFCAANRIAREQKSVSLEKRAEATYAEYRRQKASGAGGRGFLLPLF